MHIRTYNIINTERATRFDYDNTRLRVGLIRPVRSLFCCQKTGFCCQCNYGGNSNKFCVFLSVHSIKNLNFLECTCNKYCHLIGHSEVSNLDMLLIQIYKSSK